MKFCYIQLTRRATEKIYSKNILRVHSRDDMVLTMVSSQVLKLPGTRPIGATPRNLRDSRAYWQLYWLRQQRNTETQVAGRGPQIRSLHHI